MYTYMLKVGEANVKDEQVAYVECWEKCMKGSK